MGSPRPRERGTCPRSQQGGVEPRQKPQVPTARPHTPPASLGSCLRGERHEVAGRVEDVKRTAGLGVPGYPGGILTPGASWERRPTGIWSRDQRALERGQGWRRQPPKSPRKGGQTS